MVFLVLISILLLLAVLALVVKVQPKGRHISISEHAASQQWTYVLFGVALTLCGNVLVVFLYTSLGPQLALPDVFYVFLIITWILMMLTAWVPDTGVGKLSKIHRGVSLSMAFVMMLLTACVAFGQQVNQLTQVLAVIATVWLCVTLYLFFFVKSSHRHFLIFQSLAIVIFLTVFGVGSLSG